MCQGFKAESCLSSKAKFVQKMVAFRNKHHTATGTSQVADPTLALGGAVLMNAVLKKTLALTTQELAVCLVPTVLSALTVLHTSRLSCRNSTRVSNPGQT